MVCIAQKEKSLSGNQVIRKWISGEQGNRKGSQKSEIRRQKSKRKKKKYKSKIKFSKDDPAINCGTKYKDNPANGWRG